MLTISKQRRAKIACKRYRNTIKRGDKILYFSTTADESKVYDAEVGVVTSVRGDRIYALYGDHESSKWFDNYDFDGYFVFKFDDATKEERAEYVTERLKG